MNSRNILSYGLASFCLVSCGRMAWAGDLQSCLRILDSETEHESAGMPVRETQESDAGGTLTTTERVFIDDLMYVKRNSNEWVEMPKPKAPFRSSDFLKYLASPLVQCSEGKVGAVDGRRTSRIESYIGDVLSQETIVTVDAKTGRPLSLKTTWYVSESGDQLREPFHFGSKWEYTGVEIPKL